MAYGGELRRSKYTNSSRRRRRRRRRRNLIVKSQKETEEWKKEGEDAERNERLLMALSTKIINFLYARYALSRFT